MYDKGDSQKTKVNGSELSDDNCCNQNKLTSNKNKTCENEKSYNNIANLEKPVKVLKKDFKKSTFNIIILW